MEKEFTDPGPYYYTGGGQFYSAQLVRSPSETGQTSSQGPGGAPSGNGIAAPSGSGGPDVGRNAAIGTGAGVGVGGGLVALAFIWGVDASTGGILTGAAIVASIIDGLVQGFLDLFGGGSSEPPTPRQLLHGRHPLYDKILAIPPSWAPTEASAAPASCSADPYDTADAAVKAVAPLANAMSARTGNECGGAIIATPSGYAYTGPSDLGNPCRNYQSIPPGSVASYHTHPGTCPGGIPGEPSPDDLEFAAKSHVPVYFITPDGKIYKILPGGPVVPLQK